MKRSLLSLLCVILALCMVLCSLSACKKDDPPADDPVDDTPPPATPEEEYYAYSENYLTDAQFNTLKTALEARNSSFAAIDETMAPAISLNIETIGGCAITSISIPVLKTLAADDFGCFSYTIHVFGSTLTGMYSVPKRTTVLSFSADEYELAENSLVYRYITVDLSEDPIVLAENETLGLGAPEDTLLAAHVNTAYSDISTYLKKDCSEPGMFIKGGTEELAYSCDLLCFNFILEQRFADEEAYKAYAAAEKAAEDEFNAKVQALKDAGYKGKKLSIMGDSISTFEGVSNDESINKTIGEFNSFNIKNRNVCEWTMTWWGRLASMLEMDLCVANAWSGSKSYGSSGKGNGRSSMLERADELDRDNGTPEDPSDDIPPDLIIIYMGINDMLTSPRSTHLDNATDIPAAMQTWKETVLDPQYAAYKENPVIYIGEDESQNILPYSNWQEAYAMGLMHMKETYPEAEIWVMSLVDSHAHNSGKNGNIDHGNLYIRAIADLLDINLIDQQKNGYITKQNAYLYGQDEGTGIYALHPNVKGHALTTRLIIEELYKKLP